MSDKQKKTREAAAASAEAVPVVVWAVCLLFGTRDPLSAVYALAEDVRPFLPWAFLAFGLAGAVLGAIGLIKKNRIKTNVTLLLVGLAEAVLGAVLLIA